MTISCSRWFEIVFSVCWVIPFCDHDLYCMVFQVKCTALYKNNKSGKVLFIYLREACVEFLAYS